MLFEEKSRILSKRIETKRDNEAKWLIHVEEKANEIDALVGKINDKEIIKEKEGVKMRELEKELEIRREELRQMKNYRTTVTAFVVILVACMVVAKLSKYLFQ